MHRHETSNDFCKMWREEFFVQLALKLSLHYLEIFGSLISAVYIYTTMSEMYKKLS